MRPAHRRLLSALFAIILASSNSISALPVLAAQPGNQPGYPQDKDTIVTLERPVSGDAALTALGEDLATVAAAHGKSADSLKRELKRDARLVVDVKGHLFYREKPVSAADVAALEQGSAESRAAQTQQAADPALGAPVKAAAAAPAPDQAFTLHSRPGSQRTIHLDFDGHYFSGTGWNPSPIPNGTQAPAWDLDGSPATFGDAERTAIVRIWQRVAEDYAPFDVDVTTQDPGTAALDRDSSADLTYGARVVVSPISKYFGSYGGIAYVGTFDSYGSGYRTALVFPEMLGNGEKAVAEAAAHEAGHTLGLYHDGNTTTEYYAGAGTGETGWAPIMGSGYYRNLTQWSRGEYAGASNTEDDLAVIVSNGAAYRADDHGDSFAAATALPGAGSLSASGVIGRTGDADVLALTVGAGPVQLTVTPASPGADLDVALELRDAAGTLVASANPIDTLAATLGASAPAQGTYYLTVRGAGKGDPAVSGGYSAYASLGQWGLSGTCTAPQAVVTPPPPDVTPPPVVPNVAPTAVANAGTTRATAPAAIAFDGSASSDLDGAIVSYAWSFGDGAGATGAAVGHTYSTPGTYSVRLTVTDDDGATGSASVSIVVDPAPVTPPPVVVAPSMHVGSLTVVRESTRTGLRGKATVRVIDANGAPVSGATVSATWSGVVFNNSSAVTNADGVAVMTSKITKKTGTVTITVTRISKSGYTYASTANVATKASVTLGAAKTRRVRVWSSRHQRYIVRLVRA